MNISTKIQETIDDLKSCSADFSVCFNLLQKEEMKHNRLKIMECWDGILDGFIDNANEQLTQLKEKHGKDSVILGKDEFQLLKFPEVKKSRW